MQYDFRLQNILCRIAAMAMPDFNITHKQKLNKPQKIDWNGSEIQNKKIKTMTFFFNFSPRFYFLIKKGRRKKIYIQKQKSICFSFTQENITTISFFFKLMIFKLKNHAYIFDTLFFL